MIVSRAPVRFSLGGGGTDLPSYANTHGGFVVAAAVDKFIFVCIAKRRSGTDEVFVIPANAVSGPTFSLHGAGTKPYRGRYAPFRDRWSVFTESDLHQVQQPAVA